MESATSQACPTDAELAALAAAAPGSVALPLARHLAECAACQMRVLSGGTPRRAPSRRPRAELPTAKRALLLLLAVLVALAMLLYSLQQLRSVFG